MIANMVKVVDVMAEGMMKSMIRGVVKGTVKSMVEDILKDMVYIWWGRCDEGYDLVEGIMKGVEGMTERMIVEEMIYCRAEHRRYGRGYSGKHDV